MVQLVRPTDTEAGDRRAQLKVKTDQIRELVPLRRAGSRNNTGTRNQHPISCLEQAHDSYEARRSRAIRGRGRSAYCYGD